MGTVNRSFSKFSRNDLETGKVLVQVPTAPKMSARRLFATAGTLLMGLVLCYCALFYIPAFFSKDRIISLSTHEDVLANLKGNEIKAGWFTPYLDLLRVKRGYLKSGQIIEAEYVISDKAEFKISVTRCAPLVIIEIFACRPIETIEHIQKDTTRGRLKIQAPANGFYYVSEAVSDTTEKGLTYSVVWRRR